MPVTMISPDGSPITVDDAEVARYADAGFRAESTSQGLDRALEENRERAYGDRAGSAIAGGVARGLSLGLSDVAMRATGFDMEAAREIRERNPLSSTGGEVLGALAPALLSGGTSAGAQGGVRGVLAATPAGLAARAERAITATGAAGGLGTKVATAAAGGAVEGGIQSVGSYLSDVALENKELSAEGFVGAMGKGALLGGGVGGTLAGAEKGFVAARKLFPRHEITREAVDAAEQEFSTTLRSTLDEDQALRAAARRKLDEIRVRAAESDLTAREAINKAKIDQEAARAAAAQARAEAAQVRLNRTKAGPAPRGARKAATEAGTATGESVLGAASEAAPEPTDSLLSQLQRTQDEIGQGRSLADITQDTAAGLPKRGRAARPEKLPDGFDFGAARPDAPLRAGLPGVADAVDEDAIYVVSSRELADRKPASLDTGRDPKRTEQIRKGWREGKKMEPLDVTVWRDGRMEIAQGRHRLDAALEEGRDLAVRFSRGIEADNAVDDVVAKIDPEAARVAQASRKLEVARVDVADWLAKNRGKGPRVRAFATGTDQAVSPISRRSRDRVVSYEGMEAGEELVPIMPSEFQRMRELAPEDMPTGVHRQRAAAKAREYEQDIAAIVSRAAPEAAADVPGRLVDEAREAVAVLGKYEQARAELADALGDAAPAGAREASATLAAKTDAQAGALADVVAHRADETAAAVQRAQPIADIDPGRAAAAVSLPGAPTARGAFGDIKGKVADAAALVEALQFAGLPLPDIDKIPVVGPILSMYLKFRAGRGILSRFGGKVPRTAEAHVAERASQLREKAATALDRALGLAAKGARDGKAMAVAGTVAALESPLWDAGEPQKRRKATEDKKGAQELFRARAAEVMRAANDPDGARQEIARRTGIIHPEVRKAVEDAALRKLQFLADKMPKDPRPAVLFGQREWQPDRAMIERWARYVRAADDPAAVLEDLADDRVTPEAAETLRVVYPSVYGELQRRLIERAPELQEGMTYQRRMQLGLLFQVPTDPSLTPEALTYLQSGVAANEPQAQQQQPQGPPAPAVASAPRLSDDYETGAQRRASR
jgi:hypothetical protein